MATFKVIDNIGRVAPDVDKCNSNVMNFNVYPTKTWMNIEHSKKKIIKLEKDVSARE